jgi:hypothetical protein
MKNFNRFFAFVAGLALAGSHVQAAVSPSQRPPAPPYPDDVQTRTWTPTTSSLTLERLPDKAPALEKAVAKLLQQSPDRLGLPKDVALKVDSLQVVPETTGIPSMAFVHLTQTVEGTPVAGGEVALACHWQQNQTPFRIMSGRLYPELKNLPEKPLAAEEAEQKVWEKLSSEMTRFETAHAGTWVRWIDGKWRTVQLFGITPQNLIAAIDGAGQVFVWQGRIVGKVSSANDKTKAVN